MAEWLCPPDCAPVAAIFAGILLVMLGFLALVGYGAGREVLWRRRKGTIRSERHRSLIYNGFKGPLGRLNNWPDIRRYYRVAASAKKATWVTSLIVVGSGILTLLGNSGFGMLALLATLVLGIFWFPAVFVRRAVDASGGLPPVEP